MRLNTDPATRIGRRNTPRRRLAGLSPAQLIEGLEQRALLAVDLAYHGLAVANNALPGGTITVNSTIDNNGDTEASDPFDVAFYLSSDATFDSGSDTFLGTFTNSVTIPAGGNRGFPIELTVPNGTAEGNWYVVAVADSGNAISEANESDNTEAAPFFVGNTAPTLGEVTVSPNPVGSHGVLTLRAFDVSDSDNIGGSLGVKFYFDDGDEVFSPGGDTFIGDATLAGGVFTYKGAVPGGVAAGARKVIAVATDGLDQTVAFRDVTIVEAAVPTIAGVSGPTDAVRRARDITLTATGVTGTDTTVEFYRDIDGNGVLDDATDQLLGTSTEGTLTFTIDPAWGPDAQRFFARATDTFGQSSDAAAISVDLLFNRRPMVGRLITDPNALSKGQTLRLVARNVRDDDGLPQHVFFYRESSGNSSLDPSADTLLGEGVRDGNSRRYILELTVPTSFANGLNRFYVRAFDIVGERSFNKTAVAQVTRNARPVVESFRINRSTAEAGARVTFIANNVTDNAEIGRVEFWLDANANGRFDAANDRFIGGGIRQGLSNNWRRRIRLPSDLTAGQATFFAVAFDNLNVRGAALSDTLSIT